VISAAVGLALFAVVMSLDRIVLGVVIFILSLIGIYEFYRAVEAKGFKPSKPAGYVSCLTVLALSVRNVNPAIGKLVESFADLRYFSLLVFIISLALFCGVIFTNNRFSAADAAFTVLGMIYVPFMLSFLVLTRFLDDGFYFVWLIFMGAWVTDTFAYFTGRALGMRKILPQISPNKTVEGTIGGILGCALVTTLFGAFTARTGHHGYIQVYHFIILGILSGVLSQVSDWSASAVKRFAGIKDFGGIMPGHGGVLDRFDSVLFISPVIYFYISFIIL